MGKIQTSIVDRPGRASPADLANTIAILSWYPGFNTITTAQRLGDVAALGIFGKGADLGAFALRGADERGNPATMYFVPCAISTNGSITDDGATGFGPTQTITAINSHPYDDATVKVRIRDAGIPGVGTFELSTAFSVTRDVNGGNPTITPLYNAPQTIPEESAAYLTGNVNLLDIVYAKPAIVTGTVDIVNTSSLYGSGGSLAGNEFDIGIDGGGAVTVAFGTGVNAPLSYIDVLSTIADATTETTPSVTNEGYLRLTGAAVSTAGSIILINDSPEPNTLTLLGLTPATRAKVVGNVNVATFNYDSGSALNGASVIVDEDTTSAQTVVFDNTITNATQLLAALNGGTTNLTFSLTGSNFLQVESDTYGNASTIALGLGTAHLPLFGTPTTTSPGTGTTSGTAGALDGLTVLYEGDATSGAQTWTLPSGGSAYQYASSLVAAAEARTGVKASFYSAANFLRIGSETLGSASTFSITGGTGLSALGLSIGSVSGAASEYVIEHLGVKIAFPQGTYSSGYERTWTLKAPAHSITDVQNAMNAMVAAGIHVGRVVCPSYVPIGNVAGFIQGAASKVGVLEAANDAHFLHFAFGAPIDESDTAVKAAFVSGVSGDKNVGRRVDLATRIEYVRPARSSPNNTGSLVRSPLWSLTERYASLPLGSDVGQHNVGPLPYVDYAPVDEDAATVKHSAMRIDTADPRAVTLQKWADGLYFTAGFTLAPSASAYADQYVRDITLRVAQLIHTAMRQLLNDPTLATDPVTGKLTDSGAGKVASTGLAVLSPLIAPKSATEEERSRYLLTAAIIEANRDEVIAGPSGTQRLKVDVTFSVNGIARDIRITIGAGLLSAEEGQG